jgi:anti-sigma regulatory factor (Ser/Thr protein kinase)
MSVETRCDLKASMSCLPLATALVEDFCRSHGIARNDVLRLTLIVEELFTNTVEHGLGGDGDVHVRLALTAGPTQVAIVYEDSARMFDPLAHLDRAQAELEAAIAGRRASGFGLILVAGMAEHLSYAREGGWNRLEVVLPRGR